MVLSSRRRPNSAQDTVKQDRTSSSSSADGYRGYLPPAQHHLFSSSGGGREISKIPLDTRPSSSKENYSERWSGQLPFVKQASDLAIASPEESKATPSKEKTGTADKTFSSPNPTNSFSSAASKLSGPSRRRAQEPPQHQGLIKSPSARSAKPGARAGSPFGRDEVESFHNGIMFASLNGNSSTLVVLRTAEERALNPERLNLDKRGLSLCPLVENEPRLRLLNYQNNQITKICNLGNLPNLIFLDFYNNKIEDLRDGELSTVTNLRVLMLGKNRLKQVAGLAHLSKLDVLDLHSNQITSVENLDSLAELRVLNLAGNQIRVVHNFGGLVSLTELNLRRNKIEHVYELHLLPMLQRVFLSNNQIRSFDHCNCIFKMQHILELSLDNNPFSSGGHIENSSYRQYILESLPTLQHLDLKPIPDEERSKVNGFNRSRKSSQGAAIFSPNYASPESEAQTIKEARPPAVPGSPQWAHSRVHHRVAKPNHDTQEAGKRLSAFLPTETALNETGGSQNSESNTGSWTQNRHSSTRALAGVGVQDSAAGVRQQNLEQDSPERSDGTNPPRRRHRQRPQTNRGVDAQSQSTDERTNENTGGVDPAWSSEKETSNVLMTIPVMSKVARRMERGAFYELEDCSGTNDKDLRVVGDSWGWLTKTQLLPLIASISLSETPVQRLVEQSPSIVEHCNRLRKLMLSDNGIKTLAEVEKLAVFGSKIIELVVEKNDVTASPFFRGCISYFLPKVEQLNGEPLSAQDKARGRYIFCPKKTLKSSSSSKLSAATKKITSNSFSDTPFDMLSASSSTQKLQEPSTRDVLLEKRKGEKAWLKIKHGAMDRERTQEIFDEQWQSVIEDLIKETIIEAEDLNSYMERALDEVKKEVVLQFKN